MGNFRKGKIAILMLALASLLISACSSTSDREWLNADGWQRAMLVGPTLLSRNVSFDYDESGSIYLFLLDGEEGAFSPRIVGLDRQTDIVVDEVLDVTLDTRPRNATLLFGNDGIELLWIVNGNLYHLALDGDFDGEASIISDGRDVDYFSAALDAEGALNVWYSGNRNNTGVYRMDSSLSPDGTELVDPDGYAPDIAFDHRGNLHTSWIHSSPDNTLKTIYYESFQDGVFHESTAEALYDVRSSLTSVVEGPKMGLDENGVYFFWVVTEQTGNLAGSSFAYYIYLPNDGAGEELTRNRLAVPVMVDLPYMEYSDGAFQAGERVSMDSYNGPVTIAVTDLTITRESRSEIAVAFRIRLPYLRHQDRIQTGVAFLENGRIDSYQLLTFSLANTISPLIRADSNGYLYATWLEAGLEDINAFFASTAPDIRTALNKITGNELLDILAEVSFGMMSGLLLIYYPMMWAILPAILMILTSKLRRPDEKFLSLGTVATFLLSLAGYWFSKVFFLPDIQTYTPLSAWLPMMPESWSLPLRVLFPLVITVIASIVSYRATYAVRRNSPFFMLLIFMGVDGLLTMAFYGVVFYGVV